jgi:hypothetical protein
MALLLGWAGGDAVCVEVGVRARALWKRRMILKAGLKERPSTQ